jgi:hypothetical protein
MQVASIPTYVANPEDLRGLANLEAGWDTCPSCNGLACIVASNPEADEYLAQCPSTDCALQYTVVIP